MKKMTPLKSLALLITLFCVVSFGFGQIVAWEMNGNAGNEVTVNATTLNANLNTSTLSRGSGLSVSNLMNAYSSTNFTASGTQADAITNNKYLQFQVSASSGYQVSLSSIDVNFRRSGTGPNAFIWRYSLDGTTFTNIGAPISYSTNPSNGTAQAQIDLSVIPTLQNVVFGTTITFRLYGWGASATGGTFALGRLAGNDLAIGGTVVVAPPCPTSTTYTTIGGWSNGPPNSLTKSVIISDNYNTSTADIIACSLTVNNGATLTVADNTFVEVQNDITVDAGSIMNVQPYGSVVQIDDLGTVTNNGVMSVTKKTAPAAVWYEYSYWSSPVSGETVGLGLEESDASRRYVFNGQNFLDATAETGNNNATVSGQDDIDDNNNDWQWVSGATPMQPCIGYAATHDETVFNFTPGFPNKQIDYIFEGAFNNGVKTVPVYRNDSEMADNNWNLIGNPYPSAIDANLFLADNSAIATDIDGNAYDGTPYLDGAIFLWSQNTAPSSGTNGNQALNFSNDDYAIINAVGQNAGGDGLIPSRFIPSGQGFFVSMSNAAPASLVSGDIYTANVTFNNSMRVRGATDNSQFFKNSNAKGTSNTLLANKLWVNLTSDNGVFNQILVGYVNGATNNDDGTSFDAAKYPTKGSALYTTIDGSDKKFAIQGKDINSINIDEVINLGFKTTINVPTLYTLSIAQFQGDYLTNNTIYLKDNLLNKLHNLSYSDYTFTSETGEFNDRFEIVFNASALSTNDVVLNENTLSIVELEDDYVQFNTSNNLKIKTLSVFDLLGRQLYDFKAQNNSETYQLSNLNSTAYIAKVTLSNGVVITKKAIKK